MKPIISTMTALAVILAAVPGAHAGKMPIVKIQPKPQVMKIKPPRIQVRRHLPKPARLLRENDSPPQTSEKPVDPAPGPVTAAIEPGQTPAIPPLPRPRPYTEFDDAGKGADVAPETALPQENKLFDEDLVADLPGFWGSEKEDILNGAGRGALDGAFDNPPEKDNPFGFGGKGEGPDLVGLDPDNPVIQPGGPNDPNRQDRIPGFINGNPYGPKSDGGNQGPTNPSNVIPDPRGMASNGSLPNQQWMSENGADHYGTAVEPGQNGHTIWVDGYKTPESRIYYTEETDENGDVVSGSAIQETTLGGPDSKKSIRRHFVRNEDGEYIFVGDEITYGEDVPDDDDSNPNPEGGWNNGIDVAMCGSTIPMWVCMRGAGGSASPGDMLTQPSEDTGSIMGSGEGADLGREAVTNTGDASWNTTDSQGYGGSGGGEGDDARQVDPPRNPDGG